MSTVQQPLTCLFSIQIQSLEDVPEFDQHKHYSVKFKTEQSQGTTAIQTVHPHLDISDDTRDDYQFINNHLQIAQMDDTLNRASRRAFRNSVSSFTMLKDSSLTSYKVDFNEKIEFVQQMQWNMKAFEDIQASPLHPVKFHMELREHIGNSVISIGEIVVNLVEFTTSYSQSALNELDRQNGFHSPTSQQTIQSFIHSSAALKRTVLFPVYLSHERWAKLRVSVNSIWMTSSNSQPTEKVEAKPQTYFVVEEEAQLVVPSYMKHTNAAQFTPNLIAKSNKSDSNNTASETSNSTSSSRNVVTEDDEEIVKEIRETVQKSEGERLVDAVSKLKRQLNDQIDQIHQSLSSIDTKLDQMFEMLEVLEAEKIGHCKQESLEQLIPLLNEHQATDVFKAIVFCDLHGSSQLYELGFMNNQEDLILCLDLYYSVLRDCMRQCMGVELTNFAVQSKVNKRLSLTDKTQATDEANSQAAEESVPMVKTPSISDSVVCAFETTKQAVRFTLQVHLKLIEANWPESLLKLDGMLEPHPISSSKKNRSLARAYLFRGLRCRMAVDSRIKEKSLLTTVKRATFLSRYAHGGQTLVTHDSWQALQHEKENSQALEESKTRTLVQDLGTIEIDGFEKAERIRVLIPEKCKGREFQESELNVFPVQQSSLVNVISSNLEKLQEVVASEIRAKLQYLEDNRYQLQGLAKVLETSISSQNAVVQTGLKEFAERQNKLAADIQAIKHEGVVNVQNKVKGIEKDLLKLSSQFLTVQMKKRAPTIHNIGSSSRPTTVSHVDESMENADVDIQTLLERMRNQNDFLQTKIRSLSSLRSVDEDDSQGSDQY